MKIFNKNLFFNPSGCKIKLRKVNFLLLLAAIFLLCSCGRKSELQRPSNYQRPSFDGYSDEMSDKILNQGAAWLE